MDFNNLLNLFWEFLDNFKGQDLGKVTELLPEGSMALEKILKGRYAKYLPLLPLLASLRKEGLSGVLNNSDDIKNILSGIGGENYSALKDIDIASVLKFLPLITQFFRKKEASPQSTPLLPAQAAVSSENPPKKIYLSPLGEIADIADKDIIFALNRHIGKNL